MSAPVMTGQCRSLIHDAHSYRSRQCSRNGVVVRGGNLFCAQHDPEARKTRQDKWRADWARKVVRQAACAAIAIARDDAADLIERGNPTDLEWRAAQHAIVRAREQLAALTAEATA